jgi:hypothetical protein
MPLFLVTPDLQTGVTPHNFVRSAFCVLLQEIRFERVIDESRHELPARLPYFQNGLSGTPSRQA